MTVRPTSFDDGNGMWTYVHEDHGGTLDPATVSYGAKSDGSVDYDVVVVPCPEGDGVSYWPPGGGADALMGQLLHVAVGMKAGTRQTAGAVVEDVKARVVATDGLERWVLDDAALQVLEVHS